ncbi:inositol monophosphatase family protein [Pseudomonas citrulli]|uniref:Inositol monophosphatase n=1 Tax=Pseudomonas citrulli TaxID=3064347 RepID=A0ABT9C1B4_9PSED|nr:inositol monophosphatase [Pseudomonas sp. K18]MDO7898596.1 inositol monophosphatase [Pseudomonas sp. K18]
MRPLFRSEQISALEECLYEARKQLRRYWAGTLICLPDIDSENNFCPTNTEYDLECQRILLDCLSKINIQITIFTEESSSAITFGNTGENLRLLIDPLDGTHNAFCGFPGYTSSVALYQNGTYTFGWIYDLSRDVVYTAALGEGAYLQSPIIVKRLKTRDIKNLQDMRISFHRPTEAIERTKIESLMWATGKIRIYSCASLEICLIAAGVLDAFIDISTPGHERSCDIAAAELILREAGGALFDHNGVIRFSRPPSILSLSDNGSLIALSSENLITLIL